MFYLKIQGYIFLPPPKILVGTHYQLASQTNLKIISSLSEFCSFYHIRSSTITTLESPLIHFIWAPLICCQGLPTVLCCFSKIQICPGNSKADRLLAARRLQKTVWTCQLGTQGFSKSVPSELPQHHSNSTEFYSIYIHYPEPPNNFSYLCAFKHFLYFILLCPVVGCWIVSPKAHVHPEIQCDLIC